MDVGYFITGSGGSMSGGTKASLVGAISEPAFGLRDGRVQTERGAKRVRSFTVGSKQLQGVSVGSSEHFALPRLAPRLREVNAYLGLVRPRLARDAGDVGGHVGGDEGAGRGQALERRRRALRAGLDRRPGRGGPLEERLAHRGDRLRRAPAAR